MNSNDQEIENKPDEKIIDQEIDIKPTEKVISACKALTEDACNVKNDFTQMFKDFGEMAEGCLEYLEKNKIILIIGAAVACVVMLVITSMIYRLIE